VGSPPYRALLPSFSGRSGLFSLGMEVRVSWSTHATKEQHAGPWDFYLFFNLIIFTFTYMCIHYLGHLLPAPRFVA
jgi:hypothetical protein